MEHNSQPAPALGRRPSSVAAPRGTQSLSAVTVWTGTIRTAAVMRSVPLSVSAKRDMSMIKVRIRVNVEVPFNILVREQVIPVVVEQLVAESIRVANVKVAMSGTEQLVKVFINMLVIGNVNLLTERLIMVCINLVIVLVDGLFLAALIRR